MTILEACGKLVQPAGSSSGLKRPPETLWRLITANCVASIKYWQSQWDKLRNFVLDGRLEIANNRCERSVKPFVIGRKGWLFCNTPKGARTSAVIYSIVETAKENGLIPFEYLGYLFERLPNLAEGDPDELLPWSPCLPETCRARKDV